MLILQIHTLDDSPHPFPLKTPTTTSSSSGGPNPNYQVVTTTTQLNGVVHLFRSLSPFATSLTSPSSRSTNLFVVAVPNYLSPDDFLLFCGSHLHNFSQLCFLRNDGMEDRYSVLITLVNQLSADGFYCNFNGKRFRPSEAEVCHIYFTHPAICSKLAEEAGSPPSGFVELPTCPVCLERLDQDTSGIQSTLCDHSFQRPCVLKWTYLSCQVCRLCQQQDEKPSCAVCGTLQKLWVCVICGFVGCGRYAERHAIRHWKDTQHCFSLGLETQQVWDYVGNSYVHRLTQSKADGKSVTMNSRCVSLHGECGTCGCSEDSGISGALFDSKVETAPATPTKPIIEITSSPALEALIQKELREKQIPSTSSFLSSGTPPVVRALDFDALILSSSAATTQSVSTTGVSPSQLAASSSLSLIIPEPLTSLITSEEFNTLKTRLLSLISNDMNINSCIEACILENLIVPTKVSTEEALDCLKLLAKISLLQFQDPTIRMGMEECFSILRVSNKFPESLMNDLDEHISSIFFQQNILAATLQFKDRLSATQLNIQRIYQDAQHSLHQHIKFSAKHKKLLEEKEFFERKLKETNDKLEENEVQLAEANSRLQEVSPLLQEITIISASMVRDRKSVSKAVTDSNAVLIRFRDCILNNF